MRFGKWLSAALCAGALCLFLLSLHSSRTPASSQPASAASPAPASPPQEHTSMLFPGLNSGHITALSVSTPERSFHFQLDQQGAVSVNGSQADSEIFSTLLDQIAELPVQAHTAFVPREQDLVLTLVVSSGTQQRTARFYADGHTGEKTHIVLDSKETPEYRTTNYWRVGALMMTCEGTRILEANDPGTSMK